MFYIQCNDYSLMCYRLKAGEATCFLNWIPGCSVWLRGICWMASCQHMMCWEAWHVLGSLRGMREVIEVQNVSGVEIALEWLATGMECEMGTAGSEWADWHCAMLELPVINFLDYVNPQLFWGLRASVSSWTPFGNLWVVEFTLWDE